MKHKHYQLKPYHTLIILLVSFAILVMSFITMVYRDHTEASSSLKPNTNKAAVSPFSFNTAKAPGWHQGPTNTTSMAIFSSDNSCWVSFDTKAGTVDETAELQNFSATLTNSGYIPEQKDTSQLALASITESKPYKLYLYNVSGTGSAGQLYGGQQIGYVQFPSSYVLVHVYCNAFDQLPIAMPVLQAVEFDDNDTK